MNMNGFGLTDITQKVMDILSYEQVEDKVKSLIIDSVTNELIDNIGNIGNVKDPEPEVYKILVTSIDNKISQYIRPMELSAEECDIAISLCDHQRKMLKKMESNQWEIPKTSNSDIDGCISYFKRIQDSITVRERIVIKDQETASAIANAKKKLVFEECDTADRLLNELEQDIADCESKGYTLPKMSIDNVSRKRAEIDNIRQQVSIKMQVYQNMFDKDRQILAIESVDGVSSQQCQEALCLISEQSGLLIRCKKENWPCPNIKCLPLDQLEKKYQLYIKMLEVDEAIVASIKNLSTEKQYNDFYELCGLQADNIERCRKNKWNLPCLSEKDTHELAQLTKDNRKKRNQRKKRNKRILTIIFVLLGVGVLIIASVIAYAVYYFRNNKSLPMSSADMVGMNVESVASIFIDAGFDDVRTVEDKTGWKESGEVIEVSSIEKGKYYDIHMPITIKYSSRGRLRVDNIISNYDEADAEAMRDRLNKAGFPNVSIYDYVTDIREYDNMIWNITIDGTDYTNGVVYIPLNSEIILHRAVLELSFGKTSSDFLGENYLNTIDELKGKGFTNIKTNEVTTGFARGNSIIQITVNGNEFTADNTFRPDVNIDIRFSSNDRDDITGIMKNWEKKKYRDLKKELEKAGIRNIKLETKVANTMRMNDIVAQVSFDGLRYTSGDCYIRKTASVTITYYVTSVKIGHDASYFKNRPYQEVVDELKNMGFTNISLKRSNDLLTGWINKEGLVRSISINDNNKFSDSDKFRIDAKIVIVVNTYKDKGCDDITDVS